MSNWKQGYKVVRCRGETLLSVAVTFMPVIYKLDQMAFRRIGWGPLAVFESIEATKAFLECKAYSALDRIYRCDYLPSWDRVLKLYDDRWHSCKPGILEESNCPDGTDFANAVILRERIV